MFDKIPNTVTATGTVCSREVEMTHGRTKSHDHAVNSADGTRYYTVYRSNLPSPVPV